MKFFLGLALGCLLGACGAGARTMPAPEGHTVDAQRLQEVTVGLIEGEDVESLHVVCTGVWVSPNTFVTAAHCVEDRTSVLFVALSDTRDPVPHLATVLESDEDHDLALVRAPRSGSRPYARFASGVLQGEFVQTMGHPVGLWMSYTAGFVSSVRPGYLGKADGYWIQATAPTSPGNSGGGLFNARGELVGVCHGMVQHTQNVNMYGHVKHVSALLHRHEVSL